jgi:hypothetical protein
MGTNMGKTWSGVDVKPTSKGRKGLAHALSASHLCDVAANAASSPSTRQIEGIVLSI